MGHILRSSSDIKFTHNFSQLVNHTLITLRHVFGSWTSHLRQLPGHHKEDTSPQCYSCDLYLVIIYYLVTLQIFRYLLTLWLIPSNWPFSQTLRLKLWLLPHYVRASVPPIPLRREFPCQGVVKLPSKSCLKAWQRLGHFYCFPTW